MRGHARTIELLAAGGDDTVDHALDAVRALPSVVACRARALAIRTAGKMPPDALGETHYALGVALYASPATRERGVAEMKAPLAAFTEANDPDQIKDARAWLAKHR